MTNNSEISIDNLIKRIYKSYVEIKVGEFREIDRDMLLSDIGLLYTNIKNLYPTTQIPLIEFDLEQNQLINEDTTKEQIVISNTEEILISNPNEISVETPISQTEEKEIQVKEVEIENTGKTSTSFDLSMFEDANHLELEPVQKQDLIDKKSDNTSSPILKGFFGGKSDEKLTKQDLKSVPKIEEEKAKQETISHDKIKDESKVEISSKVPEIEPEKKNTNNIMDFLHHEDKKDTKDIYSFLDINTRIGLIELFFKGNSLELTECLVKLNKLSNRSDCIQVIDKFAATFGVDKKEDIYKQFVSLVDRKLSL